MASSTDSPSQVNRAAGLGVLLAACVSALVVNANTSAVTILLPAISQDLGASIDTLQWAVTGYMLVGAAVIVTSGALGDVFGRRRIFLGGLVLFVLSCALIALSSAAGGVIAGRMIQGAAGSTILACGMSLLSVDSAGTGQMRAITLWGAASAIGAAAGPLIGGVLVGSTGWQGLFWIDAAIAAACVPLTYFTVKESRDPDRPREIDLLGTVLVAVALVPLVLALSKSGTWGWISVPTIACLVVAVLGGFGFVLAERRAKAPLVDLALLRNRVLVGSTCAILLVAGVINALMYLLSLYFQDPAGFGMTALEAGLATLPAAAAMIAITPLITPVAVKIGPRYAVAIGFGLSAAGCAALVFVGPSWSYGAFVLPLIVLSIGLGLANGPASSASTSAVDADQVGQASGISNMARYVGGSLAVAAAATVSTAVSDGRTAAGEPAADALAAGLAGAALLLALMSAGGVALVLLLRRHRAEPVTSVHLAAAAAATSHTIPTRPLGGAR
ncbi:MFS transporter [Actinoplanes regularis]|uniref:Drug resistance transporter, EmrB/QacA subfamily n=1 Tax=Actinoplanes regularis TaxID=52697 RepID=A0A239I0C5_9ACTN|nr:MFS transporter [Actinoplanes regularis]GIE91265.1 MFS transporter [Actinoplanes regularis]GLW34919.1 MFS transporter [Actinoplanes regularis]SNS85914.1 drug resistance transporter, EmrB/QacA subfamily [Actinoplanes regularis]